MTWTQDQYNKWMPWIEDVFLKYFTKDNKTSYAAKGKPFLVCLLRPVSRRR